MDKFFLRPLRSELLLPLLEEGLKSSHEFFMRPLRPALLFRLLTLLWCECVLGPPLLPEMPSYIGAAQAVENVCFFGIREPADYNSIGLKLSSWHKPCSFPIP